MIATTLINWSLLVTKFKVGSWPTTWSDCFLLGVWLIWPILKESFSTFYAFKWLDKGLLWFLSFFCWGSLDVSRHNGIKCHLSRIMADLIHLRVRLCRWWRDRCPLYTPFPSLFSNIALILLAFLLDWGILWWVPTHLWFCSKRDRKPSTLYGKTQRTVASRNSWKEARAAEKLRSQQEQEEASVKLLPTPQWKGIL